jgi:hypothetical protein
MNKFMTIFFLVAAVSFVGVGIYSVATMFYLLRRFGLKSCFAGLPKGTDKKAILQAIPPWVKRVGLISVSGFLLALVLLSVLFGL